MKRRNLDNLYISYIETKDEKYFTELYNLLRIVLMSKLRANPFFDDKNNILEFDDIYQLLMIKLSLKQLVYNKPTNSYILKTKDVQFDRTKGSFITYAYILFKNILVDEKRKIKKKKVNIK